MAVTNEVGQALGRLLREGRDVDRCAAAQALGAMRYEGAGEALVDGLGDEDEDVRVDAAEALGALALPGTGDALLQSLIEDPLGEVKIAALTALGRLKDPSVVPVLRELIRGREGRVIWDDEEVLSSGWDDWLDVQLAAIETVGEMGATAAVPDIIAALEDEMAQDLDPVAFRALAKLAPIGAGALAAILRSGAERRRRRAAEALRDCGTWAACETLALALNDPCAEIRATVLQALAARDAADRRLGPLLQDPDPGVRAPAVGLIGRHWPEQLDRLFDDASEEVQAEVIKLLAAEPGLAKPQDFTFRLRVKMRGPSVRVAAAACQAFAEIDPENALADLREQLQDATCPAALRRAAARALAKLGSAPAVEALSSAIDDAHREVRTETIAALARAAQSEAGAKAATGILLKALRGEWGQPPEAAGAPEKAAAEDPAASSRAERALAEDTDEGERAAPAAGAEGWAKSTLQAITDHEAELATSPPVPQSVDLDALDEKDRELLSLTAGPRRKKHVPLNPPLVVPQDVRRLAALALGDIALDEVAEALAAQLDDPDPELCRRAAGSLARLGDTLAGLPSSVQEGLLAGLDHQDRDLRLTVTRALGKTSKTAVTALTGRLSDPDSLVRAEAARALAALGAAPREVRRLLSDPYPGARLAAAQAVARHGGGAALASLLELAFAFEGMHAAEVAGLLRDMDRDAANAGLLAVLGDPAQERKRRIAIDVLKHLNRPGGEAAPRMVA